MREFEIFPALYFRDTLGIEQEKFILLYAQINSSSRLTGCARHWRSPKEAAIQIKGKNSSSVIYF